MKHSKLFLLLLALMLSGCSVNTNGDGGNNGKTPDDTNENGNSNQGNTDSGDQGEDNQEDNADDPGDIVDPIDPLPAERRMQDTPILHCWNWSMNNIANNLQSIKDAGFKTIQISPMQTQKDYYGENGGDDIQYGWWKLYQPISFSVATKNHSIGVKSELISMCAKAEQLGIDVIVDVVFNHMANYNENTLESDGTPKVNEAVKEYEQYIYDHRNDSTNPTFHHNKNATGSGAETQYYPYGGLPDLNTSNSKVQERALSFLKECIDCGVDGFRFDAAKHIETPDDPQYASNFWTETLGKAETYYKNKTNKDLFAYGEILGNPSGRSNTVYTKLMSITDSAQGSAVLSAVKNKSTSSIKQAYNSNAPAHKLVLWGESHDTFANGGGESQGVNQDDINKAYVMQTSRKDASSLYLARPNSMQQKMGNIGSTSYKDDIVKAINNFHNDFVGKTENVSTDDGCFVNVRGGQGAAIVRISDVNKSTAEISTSGLARGSYTDIVTNKKYNISIDKVTVSLTKGVCILVSDNKSNDVPPVINVSYNEIFANSTSITVNAGDATSIQYSINNGELMTLSGNSITLDSSLNDGVIKVTITAYNQYGTASKTIELFKLASNTLINKSLIIYNIDTNYSYYCWAWGGSQESKFYSPTYDGNMMGFDLGDCNQFIITKHAKSISSPSWDNKVNQTVDCLLSKKVFNYNELTIKSE